MPGLHWIKTSVRAKSILQTLVRHGFWDAVSKVDGGRTWIGRLAPPPPADEALTLWVRIRHVLEDLGPTFVKFGQIAATREDVLPEAMVAELRKLREHVATLPWAEMEPVLQASLPGPVTDHFESFDTVPVAAGSLGQVYRATIKGGWRVAVKIRRPGIVGAVKADLEILHKLAEMAHDRLPELRPYDLPTVVAESGAGLLRELDFRNEARNAEEFNALNTNPLVFAPRGYASLSSESVYVAEWIDGCAPGDPHLDTTVARTLAKAGCDAVFHQILVSGFFHADPHAGNLRVTPDGRLAFLDWGLAGQLTLRMRRFLAELFAAIDAHDARRVSAAVLSDPVAFAVSVDSNKLESHVTRVLRRHRNYSTDNGGIGRLMLDLLRVFGLHGIRLAGEYTLLAKTVLTLEDSCRLLDPAFDIAENARGFVKKLVRESRNPLRMTSEFGREFFTGLGALSDSPMIIARILRRIEAGVSGLVVEHKGVDGFADVVDMAVNRLVFAIIVAALLVGSSLLIRSGADSLSFNMGMAGYTIAFVFTIYLIVDILRHGRHK